MQLDANAPDSAGFRGVVHSQIRILIPQKLTLDFLDFFLDFSDFFLISADFADFFLRIL